MDCKDIFLSYQSINLGQTNLNIERLDTGSKIHKMHSNDLGENNHTPANKPQKNLIIKKRLITPLITSGFESGITESSNIKHDDGVF